MTEDFTELVTFRDDACEIILRVRDPHDEKQVQHALNTIFLGLARICTSDTLMALKNQAQRVIDDRKG